MTSIETKKKKDKMMTAIFTGHAACAYFFQYLVSVI